MWGESPQELVAPSAAHSGDTTKITIGWQPSCSCGAPTVPALVLDPFMGSGTVALVAKKLNRHFLGIELNPEYVEMARKRLREEMPLFMEEEKLETVENTG